jgi:hypothetical protein
VRRHLLRPWGAITRDYGIEDASLPAKAYRYASHSVRVSGKFVGRWMQLVWRDRRR